MEKDCQNVNGINKAEISKAASKQGHVIKAEISIEIVGEDEPTKYEKRRLFWSKVGLFSVVAYIVSLITFCLGILPAISYIVGGICVVLFFLSIYGANNISPKEHTWPSPWYYGGL